MNTLPRHRELDWKIALENCRKNLIQGEPHFLYMDIVWDMDTQLIFNTTMTKILAGDVIRKKLFSDMGMEICKRSEATLLVIIGEKQDGAWIIGKCKNYWLRTKK